MDKEKKIKKRCIIPRIKKDISVFLSSEEGKINKKDMAKISMSVLAVGIAVAGFMKPDLTQAGCAHAQHSNHGNHSSY